MQVSMLKSLKVKNRIMPYQERWRDGPCEIRQPADAARCQFPQRKLADEMVTLIF